MTSKFKSAVAATVTPTAPKTSTTIPTIEPNSELKIKVDELILQKQTLAQAKAKIAEIEKELISLVSEEQDRSGFASDFHNTYKVLGQTGSVNVIFADNYSVNTDDRFKVLSLLGPYYDTLIKEEPTIKLKPEVVQNEILQNKLMELIGEHFAEFFESKINLVPVEGVKSLIYAYVTPKKLKKLRLLIKQAKPSIKV